MSKKIKGWITKDRDESVILWVREGSWSEPKLTDMGYFENEGPEPVMLTQEETPEFMNTVSPCSEPIEVLLTISKRRR